MSIDGLLRELADTATPVKTARLSRLSSLDEGDQDRLRTAWPRLPIDRRRRMLEQLADLSEDNPELDFDAVFLTALTDDDGEVRRLGIEGLWEHEHRDLIPRLVELMERDPEPEVRAAAATALGRYVLLGEFGDLRPRDHVAVTDALRTVISDLSEHIDVRARALEAAGACSQPWVRDLIVSAFDNDDDRLRLAAVHAMGRNADSRWLPHLFEALDDSDARLRYEAAGSLGSIEDDEAVPRLASLVEDEDAEVQEAALRALGDIGGADAVAILKRFTQDEDDRLREVAEEALEQAQFGDDPLGLRA